MGNDNEEKLNEPAPIKSEEQRIYKRSNHFQFLEKLRTSNKLCDLQIEMEHNTFRAHKIVLAGIPYFERMFLSDLPESNQSTIVLHQIKSENMSAFISFAYTGEITINLANVMTLIIDANFLGLVDVVNECIQYMESSITLVNVFEFHNIAETLNSISLKEKCCEFIRLNFLTISDTTMFLQLPVEFVKNILSNSIQNFKCKVEKVFEGIMKWIDYKKEREVHLPDLLKLINHLKNDEICSSPECRYICEATSSGNRSGNVNNRLVAMVAENTSAVHIFNLDTHKWESRNLETKGFTFSCAVLNNKLYKIGVRNEEDSLDLDVCDWSKMTWEKLAPIDTPLGVGVAVAAFDGCLYVCGGQSKKCTERYSPETNKWSTLSPINELRSGHQLVSLQNHLFAIGGALYDKAYNTVEMFNVQENKWTLLKSVMNVGRAMFGAAVLNEKIYIAGGVSEKGESLHSVEVYDPQLDRWSLVANMNSPKVSPLFVANNGKLWILGIASIEDPVYPNVIEVYDPQTNKWQVVQPMPDSLNSFLTGGIMAV